MPVGRQVGRRRGWDLVLWLSGSDIVHISLLPRHRRTGISDVQLPGLVTWRTGIATRRCQPYDRGAFHSTSGGQDFAAFAVARRRARRWIMAPNLNVPRLPAWKYAETNTRRCASGLLSHPTTRAQSMPHSASRAVAPFRGGTDGRDCYTRHCGRGQPQYRFMAGSGRWVGGTARRLRPGAPPWTWEGGIPTSVSTTYTTYHT